MNLFNSFLGAFFYFLLHSLLSFFDVPLDSTLRIAAETVYWIILFCRLRRKKLLTEYGISMPDFERNISAALLLIIPAWQCVLYGLPAVSIRELAALLLSALAEEMAFRVLLPKLLSEQTHISARVSVVLSSIVFAAFHGINLFSEVSLSAALLQMLYAFCAGGAFCAMVQRTRSVLPSVILHTLINRTAGNQTADALFIISVLAFSALSAGYAMIAFHNTQKGTTYL